MGGHAFGTLLGPQAVFPRMDADTYERLRRYVMNLVATHFSTVAVAREDPAKVDYGDLDVVVGVHSFTGDSSSFKVKDYLHTLLRAERAVSNGSQFISYAISAVTLDTHVPKTHVTKESDTIPAEATTSETAEATVYYQVDVNLAKDDDEMKVLPFYSSYGDLGMILALVFKTLGMSYSQNGLKIVLPSYTHRIDQPFLLSTSTPAILSFLKLSYGVWEAGFQTRTAIYEWIHSSHLANPAAILGVSPKHLERPMYQEFVRYTEHQRDKSEQDDSVPDAEKVVKEALTFFGKEEEYNELARVVEQRKKLKVLLNGKSVQKVTGLQGPIVGKIIAKVKEMAAPEELLAKSEEELGAMIEEASRTLTDNPFQ